MPIGVKWKQQLVVHCLLNREMSTVLHWLLHILILTQTDSSGGSKPADSSSSCDQLTPSVLLHITSAEKDTFYFSLNISTCCFYFCVITKFPRSLMHIFHWHISVFLLNENIRFYTVPLNNVYHITYHLCWLCLVVFYGNPHIQCLDASGF